MRATGGVSHAKPGDHSSLIRNYEKGNGVLLFGLAVPAGAAADDGARGDSRGDRRAAVVDLTIDSPALGTTAKVRLLRPSRWSAAYWLSGIELRDDSGEAARGTIDAFSHGLGVGDAPAKELRPSAGFYPTAAAGAPVPYYGQDLEWVHRQPRRSATGSISPCGICAL